MDHSIDYDRVFDGQTMTKKTKTLGEFFAGIYAWMFYGLALSAVFSFVTLNTGLGSFVFGNQYIYYGFVGGEIALLLGIQFLINKLPSELSRVLFFVYALLNGVTLSAIFVIYTGASIISTFVVSAALFGGLAVIGYKTKKDLSSWRTVLFAGMIGVFLSSIVNIFLQNSVFDIIISSIAILVFCGLTIYDNQYYKNMYAQIDSEDELNKMTTLGALHMYVNFIMIFVNLLKLFGNEE